MSITQEIINTKMKEQKISRLGKVADQLDISDRTLSNWINQGFELKHLLKLQEILCLSDDELRQIKTRTQLDKEMLEKYLDK